MGKTMDHTDISSYRPEPPAYQHGQWRHTPSVLSAAMIKWAFFNPIYHRHDAILLILILISGPIILHHKSNFLSMADCWQSYKYSTTVFNSFELHGCCMLSCLSCVAISEQLTLWRRLKAWKPDWHTQELKQQLVAMILPTGAWGNIFESFQFHRQLW